LYSLGARARAAILTFIVVVPDDDRHDSFPPFPVIKHPQLYTSPDSVLLLELHDLLDIRPVLLLPTLLNHFIDCLVPPHAKDEEKGEGAHREKDYAQEVGGVAVVGEHKLGEQAAEGQ
jgi:hypothetical protein